MTLWAASTRAAAPTSKAAVTLLNMCVCGCYKSQGRDGGGSERWSVGAGGRGEFCGKLEEMKRHQDAVAVSYSDGATRRSPCLAFLGIPTLPNYGDFPQHQQLNPRHQPCIIVIINTTRCHPRWGRTLAITGTNPISPFSQPTPQHGHTPSARHRSASRLSSPTMCFIGFPL